MDRFLHFKVLDTQSCVARSVPYWWHMSPCRGRAGREGSLFVTVTESAQCLTGPRPGPTEEIRRIPRLRPNTVIGANATRARCAWALSHTAQSWRRRRADLADRPAIWRQRGGRTHHLCARDGAGGPEVTPRAIRRAAVPYNGDAGRGISARLACGFAGLSDRSAHCSPRMVDAGSLAVGCGYGGSADETLCSMGQWAV